jgi:hypothetical protein
VRSFTATFDDPLDMGVALRCGDDSAILLCGRAELPPAALGALATVPAASAAIFPPGAPRNDQSSRY